MLLVKPLRRLQGLEERLAIPGKRVVAVAA
jgi:hypothetical protein